MSALNIAINILLFVATVFLATMWEMWNVRAMSKMNSWWVLVRLFVAVTGIFVIVAPFAVYFGDQVLAADKLR